MPASKTLDRRDFIKAAGTAAAATGLASLAISAQAAEESPQAMKKAVKWGMIQTDGSILDKFKLLKQLGFDGVEMDAPNQLNKDEILKARDETGLPIHGVVDSAHWKDTLSHPDPEVRAKGVAALEQALRDSKLYGGSTVLLVPAVVSKDVSYADAYRRSQTEIKKALPLAGELGIKIALENVWNNFLLSPLEEARYIDEFESPQVGAYFDVGNVLRYGWPEQWIRVLDKRILKVDIKEFSLKKMSDEGLRHGFQVELLEGDCDWPAVMTALREVGYRGWGTAEIPGGGPDRLKQIAELMDKIYAS
ncbi:MAG TPA: sugar phosphate isomerase/epimerase family protein [Pirellulales bacterium]|jgi:hexulose-6-phosphate isomerase|nr:sugar phosphate isomerase/epimerase family protein [Pirellulales bacterium]